ncbi:Apolipoprotein Eb [Larimichthys crocea]|uniref:Uncharacterized protein n=1 Tax=Larimichthys crocea TaxID=215358 RepID=A0ACD3QTW1_LARCR|nr:Apolipoprotein Eb [Larimichthys crocea]
MCLSCSPISTVATYVGEIQSRVTQNLDAAREQVEPYVQQAGDTANKKLTDISSMLKTQAEDLGQQLGTQAEGIKTQLEATAQELRTSLEGKIDELTELFSPLATQIREQLETIVDKVKETAASAA